MNKNSFINLPLFVKISYWALVFFLLYEIGVSWFADDYTAAVLYIVLLGVLTVSDSLYRIQVKINQVTQVTEGLRHVLPAFGRSMDFTSAQIVDTNRLVMQRLIPDEEKGELVDLTNEVYGAEAAEKLEKYLFIGPLDSIKLDQEQREKEDQEAN
jgi:hypothetical protein